MQLIAGMQQPSRLLLTAWLIVLNFPKYQMITNITFYDSVIIENIPYNY